MSNRRHPHSIGAVAEIRLAILLTTAVHSSLFALLGTHCQAELMIGGTMITEAAGAEYNMLTNNGNDAVRSEIFQKMIDATNDMFMFDDVQHATQHFDARVAVITAMKEVENGTIKFLAGQGTPPPGWIQAGGQPFYYKPGPGLSPSQAIKNIETGTTKGDCVGCVDACVMIAWRRTLGDAEIDSQLANNINLLKIDDKYLAINTAMDQSTKIPGDVLYMDNHDYPATAGPWQGENVIYIGGGKFSGQAAYNLTEDQLRTTLYTHYVDDTGGEIPDNQQKNLIKFTGHSRFKILTKK